MDPLTLGLIAAAAGMAKSQFIDKPKAEDAARMAAEQTRYSPWTGFGKGADYQAPDTVGQGMAFGVQGAAMGQNLQKHDADMKLKAAQAKYPWLKPSTEINVNTDSSPSWAELASQSNRLGSTS